jgi:carboxylesterase
MSLSLMLVSGCLGMGYGMRTQWILAQEKSLPRDPETGILTGGNPFFLEGKDHEKAALLIHGFADTPYDMRPVGEYLSANGIACYSPLLAGHGTSAKDMAETRWPDWVASAEDAYLELSSQYNKVYLVGFSMGGDIAIHLAAKYDTAGIVLLAPSIFIIGRQRLINTETAIERLSPFLMTDYIINDERDAAFDMQAIKGRAVYKLFPLTSLRSLVEFMKLTRSELPRVDEPVMVIQSLNDDTVDISGPDYVLNHVSSASKELVWVGRAKHLLTLDTDKDKVQRQTLEFIRNH